MRASINRGLIVAIGLALTACASAPVRYYTLVAPLQEASSAPAVPFLIDLQSVGVPVQVDQPQLLVRQANGGIAQLDNERWVAPLADELRTALSADLTQKLGTQDIAGLPSPVNKPVLRIKVEVRRFDSLPGQYAVINADWSLAMTGDKNLTRLYCSSRLREPVPGDYSSLVRGHQKAIATLATQISEAARSLTFAQGGVCPKSS